MAEDKRPILITGGTGFIGSYLTMDLMENGEDVVFFDLTPDLRRIEGFKQRYEKVRTSSPSTQAQEDREKAQWEVGQKRKILETNRFTCG